MNSILLKRLLWLPIGNDILPLNKKYLKNRSIIKLFWVLIISFIFISYLILIRSEQCISIISVSQHLNSIIDLDCNIITNGIPLDEILTEVVPVSNIRLNILTKFRDNSTTSKSIILNEDQMNYVDTYINITIMVNNFNLVCNYDHRGGRTNSCPCLTIDKALVDCIRNTNNDHGIINKIKLNPIGNILYEGDQETRIVDLNKSDRIKCNAISCAPDDGIISYVVGWKNMSDNVESVTLLDGMNLRFWTLSDVKIKLISLYSKQYLTCLKPIHSCSSIGYGGAISIFLLLCNVIPMSIRLILRDMNQSNQMNVQIYSSDS